MCESIKDVVPNGYRVNHLSFQKRVKLHHGKINGEQMEFKILCKVSVNFSPRDLTKMKQDITAYAAYLGKEVGDDPIVIYHKLLEAVHEKMLPGMGMRLAHLNIYTLFFSRLLELHPAH